METLPKLYENEEKEKASLEYYPVKKKRHPFGGI